MQLATPIKFPLLSAARRRQVVPADICPRLLRDVQAYLTLAPGQEVPIADLRESWRSFYETYDPIIRRFAVRCKVPRIDLEECTQEVWFKLLKNLPHFHHDTAASQFRTWLFAIVRNQVVDQIRRNRIRAVSCLTDHIAANLTSPNSDPAQLFDRAADLRDLRRAAELLRPLISDKSYRVLQLRWIEGKSIKEIAIALDLTPAQVRLRQCRMKKRLLRLISCQKQ